MALTVSVVLALPSWILYMPGLSLETLKVTLPIFSGCMVMVLLATCSPFMVSSAVKLPARPPVLATCAMTVASCPVSTCVGCDSQRHNLERGGLHLRLLGAGA